MKLELKKIINVLGIDLADRDTIAMMGEDLLEIKTSIAEFVAYVKANFNNKKLEYKKPFQKFMILIDEFKENKIALTDGQHSGICLFTSTLYKKLTWYFDELSWMNPTVEQIEHQEWQTHKNSMGENLFSEKELKVCKELGTNLQLYRLATKNKPELEKNIISIVTKLVIVKKQQSLQITHNASCLRLSA